MIIDKFHRKIDYLRIGITDRCNLRCRYCMPEEGIKFLERKDILSYDEILRLSTIFHRLGIRKIRLTGGEPLVRRDIDYLIKKLALLFDDIHLTTNATVLNKHLSYLTEIKLSSLNISLDSLDADRFHLITKRDLFDQVMSNIMRASSTGISVKINMVVMKGINDDEILDFIDFGKQNDIKIRFIEAMPFNEYDQNKHLFVSFKEMEHIIRSKYNYTNIKKEKPSSSLSYKLDSGHEFGIIPAYSRTLCGSCNRIRLTPKGDIINCLYADSGLDALSLLRGGLSDNEIVERILSYINTKPKDGIIAEKERTGVRFASMTTIGG